MGYGTDRICNEMMEKKAVNCVLGLAIQCEPEKRKSSEIEEEFAMLEKCITETCEWAAILRERIRPVLQPGEPVMPGSGDCKEPLLSPLADRLRRMRHGVGQANWLITETTDRVVL